MKEISIKCEGAGYLDLDDIKPFQGSLKNLSKENYDKFKKIIIRHGISAPVLVWRNDGHNYTIDGHQRCLVYQGLRSEGYFIPKVPVSFVEAKDKKEAKEKILAMTSQYGQMTEEGLSQFAIDAEIDFAFITEHVRFPEVDLSRDMDGSQGTEGLTDEDKVPEVVESIAKLGDIFQLGNHRLMCADSTKLENVEKLLNGEKANIVFTDPPYNYTPTNRGSGALGAQASKVGKKIEFISSFEPEEFLNVLLSISSEPFAAYIFCNTELVLNYLKWAKENKFNVNILTWHKTKFIPANSNHHYPDTEYCMFISKRPIFHSGLSPDHYRKYWIENKDGNDLHPTMKPVSIIEKCVELNSNESVLDLFGGSGSTLIACEKTNRKCFMSELDPHYVDVIIKRWEDFTGNKAQKI